MVSRNLYPVKEVRSMAVSTAIPCPAAASSVSGSRPEGFERAVMLVGEALAEWARERADLKAMKRSRSPLAGLSDWEVAALYREAAVLRDGASADRARWHVIG